MSDWRRSLLRAIGAPATPGNLRLLSSWQRWEGGHTNNDARFNWLNTTQDAPGAIGSINSVGVKKFRSYQDGVNALAMTLMNGRYDDIVQGLKTGHPYKHDLTAGLSTWVSGSPTGNLAYAQKVMGGSGAPKAPYPTGGGGARGNLALAPDRPDPIDIAFGGSKDYSFFRNLFPKVPEAPNTPEAVRSPYKAGKGMSLPLEWQGTHVTDRLGWGTKSAIDIMGAPGTPLHFPIGGEVIYYHPTGAQGGGSMLIRLENGREVWVGHITNGMKAGSRFRAGQNFAAISPDHPRPHAHLDIR